MMTTQHSNKVIVKTRCPDFYENGDHALIEVTETLVLLLDKRLAQAKAMAGSDFYGIKWWDYTPEFLTLTPEDAAVDEQEFNDVLESNRFVVLPSNFDSGDLIFSAKNPLDIYPIMRYNSFRLGSLVSLGEKT